MRIVEKIIFGIGVSVVVIVIAAITSLISAIPTYFLWNWLMPAIFGVKKITLLQAWGLNFLAGILFKSSSGEKDK